MAQTCIGDGRRNVHVAAETAAVLFVGPFLLILAYHGGKLSSVERTALTLIGLATLVVDGGLLRKYLATP